VPREKRMKEKGEEKKNWSAFKRKGITLCKRRREREWWWRFFVMKRESPVAVKKITRATGGKKNRKRMSIAGG